MNENQTENNPRAALTLTPSSFAIKSNLNSSPSRPVELEFSRIVDQNNPNSVQNAKMMKVFQKRNYIYSKINDTTPKSVDGNPPKDEGNLSSNDNNKPQRKQNNNNGTLKLQRSYTQSFSGSPKAGSYFLDSSVDGAISLQNGASGIGMLRNNNSMVFDNQNKREDASSVRFADDNHTVHHFDSEQKIESFFAILQKAAQKASGKVKKGILKNNSANYNNGLDNNSNINKTSQFQQQQLFNQGSIISVDEAKETEIVTTTQKTVRKRQISKQSSFQFNFTNQIRDNNIFSNTKAPKLKLLQLSDQLGKIDLTSSAVGQVAKSKFQFQFAQENNLLDQQQQQPQLSNFHSSPYSIKRRSRSKQKQSTFTDVKEYQYEKKQYIKRISQQIDFDESRFLQLLFNSNQNKPSFVTRIKLFGINLFKRFLSLSVINFHGMIKNYEVHTQYPSQLASIFLNIMSMGLVFFLYFFIYCQDWVESKVFLPFKSTFYEIYSTDTNGNNTALAHSGVAYQILFLWLLLLKVSENNLQLFLSERPVIKMIFSWGKVPNVLHEFKTYNAIAENIYNQKSSIFKNILAFLAEVFILVADSIALHYILQDNNNNSLNFIHQQDGNTNHNNSDFAGGFIQGIFLGLLLSMNTLALQFIAKCFIDRTTFSGFEWKLLTINAFNCLFIFCGFQLKQAAIFSDSFDFPVLFNSSKETNAQLLSYAQVQAEISFVLAMVSLVLFETFISYIINIIKCPSRQSKKVACEILITPVDLLNSSNIQDNQAQKSNDNSNQNNIDCKQQQFSTQFIEESDNRINNFYYNTNHIHKIDHILQIKQTISSSVTSRTIPTKQSPRQKLIYSSSSSIFRKAISVIVINSTLLTCIFTYPLALPLGIIINVILILSFCVDFRYYSLKSPYHSYISTFLSNAELNSLVSTITYCFTVVSCFLNAIIGLSNKNKISQSIFTQGFSYISDSDISLNIVNILTQPILLYTIIAFLFVKLLQIYQQIQKQSSLFLSRKLIES